MRDYNLKWFREGLDDSSRSGRPRPGVWFVTICARNRECIFGRMEGGRMRLSPAGEAVVETWEEIPEHYPGVKVDAFVVMPNHVHGIIRIMPDVDEAARRLVRRFSFGGRTASYIAKSDDRHESLLLALVIGYFRATTVERVNRLYGTPGVPLWQRDCYRRPVQDDAELTLMCEYIWNNPAQWDSDRENPARFRTRAGHGQAPLPALPCPGVRLAV